MLSMLHALQPLIMQSLHQMNVGCSPHLACLGRVYELSSKVVLAYKGHSIWVTDEEGLSLEGFD